MNCSQDPIRGHSIQWENIQPHRGVLGYTRMVQQDFCPSVLNNANEQKQQQIDSLAEKIRAIEQKDLEAKKRKAVFKSKVLLAWAIIWKLLIVIAVVVFTKVVCKIAKVDFGTWLSIVIGVAGLIGIIIQIVKRDIKNHKERCYHNSSENEEL